MTIASAGNNEFELKLTPEEQRACDYLDELNTYDKFFEHSKPSDLLKGAIWLVRNPDKSNPDRLYQAAHSLRDIFYCLGNDRKNKLKEFSELTVEEQKSIEISNLLHELYVVITNIAHHFNGGKSYQHSETKLQSWGISVIDGVVSDTAFEGIIKQFVQLLKRSSVDFVEIHRKIDEVINAGFAGAKEEHINFLFNLHFDAKNYFFSKVGVDWFDWLLDKGLLETVKNPPKEDSDERYYHSPEMEYLIRVSETHPDKFADFFQSFTITDENLDIGILNRAIWATEKLPAQELKKMAQKICDEEWVKLLGNVRNSGFQYDGMFETLVAAEEWDGVLILAEALLKIKPKDKDETDTYLSDREIFYVDDLGYSKIYSHLINLPEEFQEKALKLAFSAIVEFEKRNVKERGEVHADGDNLSYMDTDFFTVSVSEEPGRSSREQAKNIAATYRILIEKTLGSQCSDPDEVRRLYTEFVEPLPNSRSMWRLKLFVMSRCPEVFKEELKTAFFKLFETGNRYHEIDGGAEYQKALSSSFGVLDEADRRDYVSKTFDFFVKLAQDNPEEKYHLHSGWENLSSISKYLTPEEVKTCEEKFGIAIEPEYEPHPIVGQSMGGMVSDRSPVDLSKYSVPEIISHLKDDWTPQALDEKYKGDDFLHPRNAQGLGDAIKEDMKVRTDEYLSHATDFFDRDNIHPHYTYSFVRGVEEMLRNKNLPEGFDWNNLFKLFKKIRLSGQKKEFDYDVEDGRWLSRWIPVHDAIADTLLHAQTETYDEVFPFGEFRDEIFEIIKYCSTVDDPKPENETTEYGDLHGIAINAVKGRAFQVFTHFVHYDGKEFPEGETKLLKEDVKALFKEWLEKETSKAVRFMFGYHLQPFYFRDKKWFQEEKILTSLFEDGEEALILATWEGYLNQSLHEELFNFLEKKYIASLEVKEEKDGKHSRERGFDELIGTHVALAFLHFDKFTRESDLFKALWSKADAEKQKEFVSFIGRHFAHRSDDWRRDNRVDIDKLKDLWDWILENVEDPTVYSGFGFWVSHERDSFEIEWLVEQVRKTIIKSEGNIDWDYGIIQNLEKFANTNPKATLEILDHYLLQGENLNPHRERWFMIDRELVDTLKIIYSEADLKESVKDLVNRLIQAGGQQFWPLQDILD